MTDDGRARGSRSWIGLILRDVHFWVPVIVLIGGLIGTFAGLKVVKYHHTHPDNRVDRWLLGVTFVPEGDAVLGNLIFAGDSAANFVAFDAVMGVPLWHAGLHTSITNGPITYALEGTQYVVVGAGDSLYAFSLRR
mgnify:CR=1 FL=1